MAISLSGGGGRLPWGLSWGIRPGWAWGSWPGPLRPLAVVPLGSPELLQLPWAPPRPQTLARTHSLHAQLGACPLPHPELGGFGKALWGVAGRGAEKGFPHLSTAW